MKKITFITFLSIMSISFVNAQTKKYITIKDFVPNINNQIKCDKIIKTESGENDLINTKIFIGKSKNTKTDLVILNDIINDLLLRSRIELKNKSSFKATQIRIYEENTNWITYINYSGTNDLGGRKDSELSITYDKDMKIIKTFSPY